MMKDGSTFWQTEDLVYVARVLAPASTNPDQIITAMREDPVMLEAMLADERLFHHLMDEPTQVLDVSSRLFFSVLLIRAREDLRKQTFTFEKDNRYSVVVFDSNEVIKLLEDLAVRNYLADMLSSFVRIGTKTLYVSIHPGVFERITVDDFDIGSLIDYSQKAENAERLFSLKRIGDICLFLLGVFSDYVEVQRLLPGAWYRAKSRKELAECGTYYYRQAFRQAQAGPPNMGHALERLSAEFLTAVKPLMYVSSRYLGFVKRTVFLQ